MRAERRATVADVAQAAGVSVGTVSRVLNGRPDVSPARREAVERAMRELGYRRNASAAKLRKGSGVILGLLVEDVADPFYSHVHRAVEERALEQGWALIVASGAGDAKRALAQVRSLAEHGVDALLATLPVGLSAAQVRLSLPPGMPLVLVDRPAPGEVDSVVTDNRGGAGSGVAELLRRGHTRIACLVDRDGLYTAQERHAGYLEALAAAGVERDAHLEVWSAADKDLVAVLLELVALESPPTAVFAGNNRVSAGVLRALRDPDLAGSGLEILGFDDLELAELLEPPLSVVEQDAWGLGSAAVDAVVDRLAGGSGEPILVQVPARLVVR